ncbi:hypothetical protein ACQ4M3_06575 [Leptolyngbya sp. AN03gr2]|uniref:hypothetical protein n=1 Tax=unclassified Leptolyngbya TaxID=2650499 RepID=UPI003D3219CB
MIEILKQLISAICVSIANFIIGRNSSSDSNNDPESSYEMNIFYDDDDFDDYPESSRTMQVLCVVARATCVIVVILFALLYIIVPIIFHVSSSTVQFLKDLLTLLFSLPIITLDRIASIFSKLFGVKDPATAWYFLGFVLSAALCLLRFVVTEIISIARKTL